MNGKTRKLRSSMAANITGAITALMVLYGIIAGAFGLLGNE